MRPRFESGQGHSVAVDRRGPRWSADAGGAPIGAAVRSAEMEAVTTSQPPRRRRRSPKEAEREIITAAETLLRERPFRELTVDEVMRRTGLSRPSFYVYFKDRHELVLRVVEHLQAEQI